MKVLQKKLGVTFVAESISSSANTFNCSMMCDFKGEA